MMGVQPMKMFKANVFILFVIFTLGFAQNNPLQISTSENFIDKDNFSYEMNFSLNENVINGFVLKLPESVQMVPAQIEIAGETVWLKESSEIPAANNVVHWSRSGNELIVLLAVQNNSQIKIQLNGFSAERLKNIKQITVHRLQLNSAQNYESGEQLSSISLFQNNNNEVR